MTGILRVEPVMSVVIPAHDEAAIIGQCLRRIVAGAGPGEIDVVVVCNACADDTAVVARSVGPPVRVVETAVGGKPHALNLGDAACEHFPRFYVDADVRVSIDDLRTVAAAMGEEGALVAAPGLRVDTSASNPLVRAYYSIWLRLPWVQDGLIGSGVYAMTEAGRRRFTEFPSVGADDLWVRAHFDRHERASVREATFTVPASRTAREVVRRKARILAANRLLTSEIAGLPGAMAPTPQRVLGVVRKDWRLAPAAVVYAIIGALATFEGRRMARTGTVRWGGDRRHVGGAPS